MGKDQQAGGAMDVDAWKAFGGTVEGKVYVAPGGERAAPGRGGVRGPPSPHGRLTRDTDLAWRAPQASA